MKKIFQVLKTERDGKLYCQIVIPLKIGEFETMIPVTQPSDSLDELKREVETLKIQMDDLLKKAEEYLAQRAIRRMKIHEGLPIHDVWSMLCEIEDEEEFVIQFNSLSEGKRRQLADYVLTKCNIFSGKASVFSSRYNSDNALME
jgi:hypothetical protein